MLRKLYLCEHLSTQLVLLGAKKDISSSEIISSLNRSSTVASSLVCGWFGELDADLG